MLGASKSCFIACPTNDDLEPILGLMSEKLNKFGVETIVAVKERAYGQDIFCTKICGKIIESRFCIVILDDSIKDENRIPNPNVYYEYGLMTALRKHIIPLQKENLDLAFNIQSYDTIKYNNKNITTELDSAIRDAIRLTEAKEPKMTLESLKDKFIYRRMELAGFEGPELEDMEEIIYDTEFKTFIHNKEEFVVLLCKVDNDKDAQSYIDDLRVVILRIEKLASYYLEQIEKPKTKSMVEYYESSLKEISKVFIGFIINSEINHDMLLESTRKILDGYARYNIVCNHEDKIQFGEVLVNFGQL